MNLPSDRGNCPLCATPHATSVVVQGPRWRLQRAEEAGFPAFYRLVWQAHVAEMSDLSAPERQECMELVNLVEALMRSHPVDERRTRRAACAACSIPSRPSTT
jgi:diadenosine tetraphosphate (Ap4A) HIT family hydrolase